MPGCAQRGQVLRASQSKVPGTRTQQTQHTARRAAQTLSTTASPSPTAALPAASFSGGRRGAAAGRKENSVTR